MSLTIKEIAKLANTSRGTVDRVLNQRGGVSKETEEKILKIINEHGYRYNEYARALVNSRKSHKIGIITSSIGSDFYTRVLKGIKEACNNPKHRQIEPIIIETRINNYQDQIDAIEKLENQVEGLIITSNAHPKVKELLEKLTIPVVTCTNDIELESLAFVGCNYYNNGHLCGDLASVILDEGKILIITSDNIKGYEQRVKGFMEQIPRYKYDVKQLSVTESYEETYTTIKNYLFDHQVDLIFFSISSGTNAGLDAISDLNYQTKILTVDEDPAVIDNLKKGKIAATVTQQPEKQGRYTVIAMNNYFLLKQQPVNNKIIIGNKIKLRHSNFDEVFWDK